MQNNKTPALIICKKNWRSNFSSAYITTVKSVKKFTLLFELNHV